MTADTLKLKTSLSKCVSKKTLELCEKVLDLPAFSYYPASLSKHHSHVGGLAMHTKEAWEAAKGIYMVSGEPLIDVVAAGVVFHDIGKTMCYKEDLGDALNPHPAGGPDHFGRYAFSRSDEYYDMYHIVLSYEFFKKHSKGMSSEFIRRVSHCILSHHGQQSAGSPVVPTTKEAWAVYLGDVASVTVVSNVYPKARNYDVRRYQNACIMFSKED